MVQGDPGEGLPAGAHSPNAGLFMLLARKPQSSSRTARPWHLGSLRGRSLFPVVPVVWSGPGNSGQHAAPLLVCLFVVSLPELTCDITPHAAARCDPPAGHQAPLVAARLIDE